MAESTPALKMTISKFQSFIVAFNDKIADTTDIMTLQILFEQLLDDFFARITNLDHKVFNSILVENKVSNVEFMANAECYIIEQVYDMLYFKLTTVMKSQDEEFSGCLKQIKCLDLCQMGVYWKYGYNVVGAIHVKEYLIQYVNDWISIKVLRNLSSLRTPIEKVECLVDCIKLLAEPFEICQIGHPPTTDQLIPLILIVIIRSDILHFSTNLYYIRHFSFEHDINSGYQGIE